jgi:hypothetical protein
MSAATQIAYIGITIPTANDGQWGGDTTDEQAALVAGNVAALLEEHCRRTWPEAELEVGTANDTRQRIVVFNGNDDDTGPAVHNCHLSIENMLAQYVEEPLWEQGFDAAAYLDELDRNRAAHAAR